MTDRRGVTALREPLQVWLPHLGGSLGRPEVARDAQRAFKLWRGDLRVWLAPEFPREVRWLRGQFSELAIPAEHLDCVDIYHVSPKGRAFGLDSRHRFPAGRIGGLLDAWLNLGALGGCRSVPAPEFITVTFPTIHGQGVTYDTARISVEGGATFPQQSGGNHDTCVYWPPMDRPVPPTVFPDAESLSLNLPVERRAEPDGRFIVAYSDGTVADQVVSVWPDPIAALMPFFTGFDELTTLKRMVEIATRSRDDPEDALRAAKEASAPYIGRGHAPRAFAWLYPTFLNSGPEAILTLAAELGVSRTDIHEAYLNVRTLKAAQLAEILSRSAGFREAMAEQIELPRVWGALGLLWFVFIEALETQRSFRPCQRCGRITAGKSDKRFCGPDDNPDCFRARRAQDRRRSRERKR